MPFKSTIILALLCLGLGLTPADARAQGAVEEDGVENLGPLPPPDAALPEGTVEAEAEEEVIEETLDDLFASLRESSELTAPQIERRIRMRWDENDSASMELLLQRGRKALEKQEARKAEAHFMRLVAFAPDFAEGWHALANARFMQEDYGAALRDLRQALALEPRHFSALTGVGAIMETLERPREAFGAYSAALEIHPHLEDARQGVERMRDAAQGRQI